MDSVEKVNARLTGAGRLYSWGVKFLRKDVEAQDQRLLPAMLVNTLSQIDGEAIVLAHGEVPIFVSPGIEQIGLLKDGKVQSAELLATVRVVRPVSYTHLTLPTILRV